MTINRERWLGVQYPLPRWLCPRCQQGHYQPVKDTSARRETKDTKTARNTHPDWDPEWAEDRFVSLLQCDNPECREVASFAAVTHVHEVYEVDASSGYERPIRVDSFEVTFVDPAPVPVLLSPEVPEEMNRLLRDAAKLYWQDAEAAGNKLRQVAEEIMDERGIRKTDRVRNSARRQFRSLHSRITDYRARDPDTADLLLAVKWIGNAGSHPGGLEQKDILDGFEMLDHVFERLYRRNTLRLVKLAKGVNKKKGPIPAKKRKRKK